MNLRRYYANDAMWAVAIAVASFAMFVLLNLPFLFSFAISGDDYALVHHSARFFSPSVLEWILDGYREYNVTFPELGGSGTNFIRPAQNATVYVDSWFSHSPRSVTMLLSNYAGHAACVALVFLVGRSIFGLSRMMSLLTSGLLFGSVAVALIPYNVAYRGDMIAAMFALTSLLVLHSHVHIRPAGWKVVSVGASLLLALFAKESVLLAPFVLAVDAFWIRPGPPEHGAPADEVTASAPKVSRIPVVIAIAVPCALFAAARLAAGLDDMYVAEALPTKFFGIPRVLLEPVRFGLTAFFPVETETLKATLNGSVTGLGLTLGVVRGAVAVVLNVAGWLAIARLLLEPGERVRLLPLVAMGILASAVPILKAEPRIMYFSQAVLLPLFVYAITRWSSLPKRDPHLPRWLLPIGVSVILTVGPAYFAARQIVGQPGLVAYGQTTRHLQDVILDTMSNRSVRRLYLVNAKPSMSPGLGLLRFLRAVSGRPELRLRVVNTFAGEIPADDGEGGVEFMKRGPYVEGIITAGSSQTLFTDLSSEGAQQLGETGIIEYGRLTEFETDRFGHTDFVGRKLSFRIPNASRKDFAIIGLDPGREGVFALSATNMRWKPV